MSKNQIIVCFYGYCTSPKLEPGTGSTWPTLTVPLLISSKKSVNEHKTHKNQYFLMKFWESRDYDHSKHIEAKEFLNEV